MAHLLAVRHAEPIRSGIFLGALDLPLSTTGHLQAQSLAAQLPTQAAVYCSPLLRARQTADALARPYTVIPDLRELSYGPWEGLTWAEIEARDSALAARKLSDWQNVTVPGAEPWPDFRARVLAAVMPLIASADSIILVAHLAVNSVLAEHFTGTDPLQFHQPHATIHRLL